MGSPSSGEPMVSEPGGEQWISPLTPDELDRAVREADPGAFLLLPRILRRVIKQDRRLAGFGLKAPHRKSYWIAREPLLKIVEKDELGVSETYQLPETVVLLARPDPRKLAETSGDEILIRCWRLLFHARIHVALDVKAAAGDLSPAMIHERIREIGSAEFDEIRMVLGQENLLLPPHDDESIYMEFAATYLELRWFAPSFLPRYFPGLANRETVEALILRDVDAEGVFLATRPRGAPDPRDLCELDEWSELLTEPEASQADYVPLVETPSETKYRFLMHKSQRPASLGNVVRAAIYRARAERCAPPEWAGRVRASIKLDVFRLIRRLQAALELEEASPQPWQESLFALVNQTPRGIWTVEARLLYDLQKVCVDHERNVYTVDLVEWALSWGRRPLKRRLPSQRDVLMLKHLRSAAKRLSAARISEDQRRQLARLVHEAMDRAEARLRENLRPKIADSLGDVDLTPQNPPEQAAKKKLIEELLDQIVDRGFLAVGDLRDAISRNNLKFPDLSGPFGFLQGDQLLRADRRLALALDGVYRRGESYLRWMQRFSSLAFGTRLGRFLTRFAAVPLGGSYVTLVGIHEILKMVTGTTLHGETVPAEAASQLKESPELGFQLTSPSVLLLAAFLLFLVNSAMFRKAVGQFFLKSFHALHAVVVEPILWVVQSPLLQQILRSRTFRFTFRFLVKPLLWTGIFWWLLLDRINLQTAMVAGGSFFLAINLMLNSRLGRNLEEVVADEIVQGWHRFGLRLITGLFWLIVDVFKRIMETVERLMYGVDEWLRFRSGESGISFSAKAVMGLFWFFLSYVLRFAVNVLLEPQINPIKHFPVVTVGHKLLFAMYKPFAVLLEAHGMSEYAAWLVALVTIWCIPGIFGFLVWELKENWRLYAANRPKNLGPMPIGSHGETMGRLLRPGFHSGTLPKRFAKLRRAERLARSGGNWRAVRKNLQALHHAELSLRRWIQREFLVLFDQSRCWQAPPVTLDEIRLGTNSVEFDLGCAGISEAKLRLAIDVRSGWLTAGASDLGWTERLLPRQRHVLACALLGLYKSSGIELVWEQIESLFSLSCGKRDSPIFADAKIGTAPPPTPWYDLSTQGLILWPDGEWDVEVLYDLHEGPWIAPQSVRGLARRPLPTLERWQLVFGEVPISWEQWVLTWNQDLAGQYLPSDSIAPVQVLPAVRIPTE